MWGNPNFGYPQQLPMSVVGINRLEIDSIHVLFKLKIESADLILYQIS